MKFTVSEHLNNIEDTFVAFSAMHGQERGTMLSNIIALAAAAVLAADHMKLVASLAQRGKLPDAITESIDKVHGGLVDSVTHGVNGAILSLATMKFDREYSEEEMVAFRVAALKQAKLALDKIGDTVRNATPNDD